MASSFEKLENTYRSIMGTLSAFIWWKYCENRSSTSRDIRRNTLNTMWTCNAIFIRIFSSETTGRIFTKILHDVVALVALLNLAHIRRYPYRFWMPERRMWGVCHFWHKIVCHGNVPWDIEKRGPGRSSKLTPKKLSLDVKIGKIGPADLEIICLGEIINKD